MIINNNVWIILNTLIRLIYFLIGYLLFGFYRLKAHFHLLIIFIIEGKFFLYEG